MKSEKMLKLYTPTPPLNPSANDYVIYELTLAGAEAVTDLHLAVGTSVISVLGLNMKCYEYIEVTRYLVGINKDSFTCYLLSVTKK